MNIKTWQEEAKEWPEHRRGLATNQMIWMQQEINELRAAIEALQKENERLTKCLISANANHEKFERQYYLELNKVEDLTESTAAQAKQIAELEGMIKNSGVK